MILKGIFSPIATPFLNNEVSYEKLKENLNKWNETGLGGYVVLGSNGEPVFLTRNEKLKLIEITKENISGNKKLIAGTGTDSIKETIELSNEAANRGADAALILIPSYFKGQMKDEAFIRYFTEIADNIKVPLLIYNVPKFTGINIEAETVTKLAEHKNIIGLKNSSENVAHLSEIIYQTPDEFIVLAGTASILYPGLCMGAVGGVLALANVAPAECIMIQKYFEEENYSAAQQLQMRMLAPNKAITAKYGVPGLKAAMDLTGYFGGEPRRPLKKLNESQTNDIRSILLKAEIKIIK